MAAAGSGLIVVGFLMSHQVLVYALQFVENPKDTPFYSELADVSEQFVGSIVTLRANLQNRHAAGEKLDSPKPAPVPPKTTVSEDTVLTTPIETTSGFTANEIRKNAIGDEEAVETPTTAHSTPTEQLAVTEPETPNSSLTTHPDAPIGERIEYRSPTSDFSFVAGKPVYFFLGTVFAISILSICVRLLLGLLSAGTELLVASIRTSLHVSYVPVDDD